MKELAEKNPSDRELRRELTNASNPLGSVRLIGSIVSWEGEIPILPINGLAEVVKSMGAIET